MNIRRSSQDDEVLVSPTDQERPGVIVHAPGRALSEALGSKLKDDDNNGDNDSASGLNLRSGGRDRWCAKSRVSAEGMEDVL